MAQKRRVDSFHLGLSVVGDSSIHLLIDEPQNRVSWAMLVDGGTAKGAEHILKAIQAIEKRYNFKLAFNCVIITHWDADHYAGVLNAIFEDVCRSESEGQAIKDVRVSFFQYDKATGNPDTVVYCPEMGYRKDSFPRFGSKPATADVTETSFVVRRGGEVPRACKICVEPSSYKPGRFSTMLGANLVTGRFLPSGKDADVGAAAGRVTSPAKLISGHQQSPGDPGIYIIAVSGRTIGSRPTSLSMKPLLAPHDQQPCLKKGFHGTPIRIVNEHTTSSKTNLSSIACMIMWPGNPPRLSHYFAGDLFWKQEDALVKWTGADGKLTTGSWVPTVKASHHGAKSSTPVSILTSFNPRNLIASVANKHGHPSWELVLYVEGWVSAQGPEKAASKPLLTTQFPYYLLTQVDPHSKAVGPKKFRPSLDPQSSSEGFPGMTMTTLKKSTDTSRQYRTELEDIFKLRNVSTSQKAGRSQPLCNPLDQMSFDLNLVLNNGLGKKEESPARAWIRKHIAATWSDISPVDSTMHPYIGDVWSFPGCHPVQSKNRLSWFRIESHDNDDRDGTVFVKHDGDPDWDKPLRDGKLKVPATRATPESISMVRDDKVLGSQSSIRLYPRAASNVNTDGVEIEPWYPHSSAIMSGFDTYGIPEGTNPDEMEIDRDQTDQPEARIDSETPIMQPRPDPGLPIAGPRPSPSPESPLEPPYYFICASTTVYASGAPSTDVKQLTLDHPMNNFLSTLHLQGIILATAPAADMAEVTLHQQDQLLQWLSLALERSVSSSLTAAVKADAGTGNITQFSLEAPSLGATYSSQSSSYVLTETLGSLLGPAGTVPWQNSLILGLQNMKCSCNLTLKDILAPARARKAQLPHMDLLTLALGDEARFDVDSDEGSRNALWFEPMAAYRTVVRTQYKAQEASLQDGLGRWVKTLLPGLSVDSVKIITRLKCTWAPTVEALAALNEWELVLMASCALDGLDVKPTVMLDFDTTAVTAVMQFDYHESRGEKLLKSVMDWLGKLTGAELTLREWFDGAGGANFSMPLLRRVTLTMGLDSKAARATDSVENVSVDVEVGVKFGRPDVAGKPQKLVFLFTYQWSKARGSSLQGSLWCPPPPDGYIDHRLLVEYEPHLKFQPCSVSDLATWVPAMDLVNLIPADPSTGVSGGKILHIPDGVPTEVNQAVLELNGSAISFKGALFCRDPKSDDIPKLLLSGIQLNASYILATKKFHVDFDFGALMWAQPGSQVPPIELRGSVTYDGAAGWAVEASVETPGMQCAHLLNFFDDETGATATALVQHITLNYLSLTYQYAKASDKGNAARCFRFQGSMSIGRLTLGLLFEYTGPKQWELATDGSVSGDGCTVQEILDSIVGDGTVELPSFVADISVGKPSAARPAGDRKFFELTLSALPTRSAAAGARTVVVTITVNAGPVSFTFVQFRNTDWSVHKRPSKRFLRVDVTRLPDVDIPLVGKLSQPFDEMCFVWVQDGSETAGLTLAEVEELNKVPAIDGCVYYKQVKAGDDAVVQAGCHFMLVAQKTVVLDYVLPMTRETTVPTPVEALQWHAKLQRLLGPGSIVRTGGPMRDHLHRVGSELHLHIPPQNAPVQDTAASGPTKASFARNIGALDISNIGIVFRNGKLSLCLDADVHVGPIALALQGFSIDVDLRNRTLQGDFSIQDVGFSLQGMVMALDRPPLILAGGLIHRRLASGDLFTGGVAVGFSEWAFLAASGYGQLSLAPSPAKKFDTAFVFSRLDGPLVTLECATLSGLTGGIGYNSTLTLPTVDQVPEFPFLRMPAVTQGTGDATMDTLKAILGTRWFAPQNESFWVGAGLTVTACQVLDIAAVVVVKWDPDITLAIDALAVADVPSTNFAYKLAHVELGIIASINFASGVACFEGQLAPSSFILDPSCHLSGGFALYYRFTDGPQENKGDWVFTIGGYHPRYRPPPQHPNPPRLQIAWSLGPLSITGQAYFAITPSICMAGGLLHVALVKGVLEAFFDVSADFLIAYHPFSFWATSQVDVGVHYQLDAWFITEYISVDISATVKLQGPPIAGTCHVDFWVFGFDIQFGSTEVEQSPKRATLPEFYDLVNRKGNSPAVSTAAAGGQPVPHVFRCLTGIFAKPLSPAPNQGKASTEDTAAAIWTVSAGTFSFSLTSVFAVSKMTVYPGGKEPMVRNVATGPIYSQPMRLSENDTALESDLKVNFTKATSDGNEPAEPYEPKWELRPVITNVPTGLWGKYNATTDPLTGSTALLDSSSDNLSAVPLTTGFTFVAPPPVLAVDRIPAFDAVRGQLQSVTAEPVPFPPLAVYEDPAWIPAQKQSSEPWNAVRGCWKKPKLGGGAAKKSVAMWARAMKWPEGCVDGGKPVQLVDHLERWYSAAPIVAAVV